MKLRSRDSRGLSKVASPWYCSSIGMMLSGMLLLPVVGRAADAPAAPATPAAPAAAVPASDDDHVEQELQVLRQLAQQMLNRIDALERTQRAKKGLAAAPGTDPKAAPLANIPAPAPLPAAPVVDNTPLPVIKVTPKSFVFSGNTVYSAAELNKVLETDLGKEVDFDGLQDVVDKVKAFYRSKGYFLALALLPKQEIADGSIKIEILEGRIGKIRTKTPLPPNSTLTESQFKGMIDARLKEGDLITENSLERPLLQLRDLPGVDVRSTINPGEKLGTADIDLEVVPLANGRKIFANIELDNAGNRFAGEYRATLKSSVNGLFGVGDVLNVSTTIGQAPLNVFGRIGYLAPFGYAGTRAGFNVSRLNYLLGKDFAALNVEGNATITELLAVHPFYRNKEYNLFGQVSLENKLLTDKQGSIPVQKRQINSLKFQANGDLRWGASVNTGSLDFTLGHLNIKNTQDALDDQDVAGYHTGGTFAKVNFTVNRLQALRPNLEAWFAVSGQLASKNLTSAEKFVLGGPGKVRGYPSGEAGGDQGFVATGELRYSVPNFKFYKASLAVSAFVDYGWIARNAKPGQAPQGDGSSNTRSLLGYGIGLNLGAPDIFVLRSDLAWGASGASTSDTKATSPRLWFQGVKWF